MNKARQLIRLMRPHQWVKNGFVLVGLIFGHIWDQQLLVTQILYAAAAFCLVASAIYVINDIADRENDRNHPTKSQRPIAAGQVSIPMAITLALALLALGGGLGLQASVSVLAILVFYLALNLGYSFGLKTIVILDVFIVSAGFMLRIFAGTLGVGIQPSKWLLLCSLMLTLFLGLCKRRSEIHSLADGRAAHRSVLAQYDPALLDLLIGISAACVLMSYGLYTMSEETIAVHQTSNLIYTLPFVIYAMFRYIYSLHRFSTGGDPAKEIFRDPHIIVASLAWLILTLWLIG